MPILVKFLSTGPALLLTCTASSDSDPSVARVCVHSTVVMPIMDSEV